MYTNEKFVKNDYKEVECFYDDDFLKNTDKIESIKCYHCHQIHLKSELNNLYLIKVIIKTQVFNSTIFNARWYPLCNTCQNNYENVIIKNLFKI